MRDIEQVGQEYPPFIVFLSRFHRVGPGSIPGQGSHFLLKPPITALS